MKSTAWGLVCVMCASFPMPAAFCPLRSCWFFADHLALCFLRCCYTRNICWLLLDCLALLRVVLSVGPTERYCVCSACRCNFMFLCRGCCVCVVYSSRFGQLFNRNCCSFLPCNFHPRLLLLCRGPIDSLCFYLLYSVRLIVFLFGAVCFSVLWSQL